ncbi:PAS domain-containing protein [Marinobacter halotolerans]|uniref:PAS domain-containing protein n=1 Tax=Marinobacter halotolerans TaxID=1569211 RepID=UPI001247408E|nr:PAS domain-containing protein [Marinobacter halotolerans]
MKAPGMPTNEALRQAALDRSGLLDTGAEERFDRFTRMVRFAFNAPIALVSLVDRDRQWFKSADGLSVSETPRDISFCGYAIHYPDMFVIEDTLEDDRFRDNPLVTSAPLIRFYAGAPLRDREGFPLGTLCIIDQQPRTFDQQNRLLLREFADCVEQEIKHHAASKFYAALRKSEGRTRAIIEGTRVGTWEWNVQTDETVFNQRWAEICGYRLEELEPVSIQTWLSLAHPDDLAESERLLQEHFKGHLPEYDFRCRMRHKSGHWIWVHDRGQVLEWTDAGEPLMMFGTHADVTEEMQNLERIQQQNRALSILNELALGSEADDDARIQRALSLATDYLDLPIGIVSEINSRVYSVRWFAAPEGSGLESGASFALEDTYCSMLFEKNESLAISHMAKSDYRHKKCYNVFGLESYLAAPIYVRDRLFGTLNFSSPEPRQNVFSDTEVTFVTLLARWVASVLERTISVQMLTKLVDQTPGALYQYRLWPDGSAAFPFASPHIRDIYGLENLELKDDASKVFDRIHPSDLGPVTESIDRSAESLTVWQHQYRVKTDQTDSAWRWVEGKASPERMPDDSVVWHGYIADIDEKKRTELALYESEAQLRRLYELSPIGIALNDFLSGEFLDVNEALLEPTGYSRAQLMAKDFRDLLLGDAEENRWDIITSLKENGRFGPLEISVQKSDHSHYPALIRGIRIKDSKGRPLVWTLIEDISERKKVDRMKSEFISTVSHELRTPLTSITGSLGLIAGGSLGALPEQVERMIAIAYRNSEQLKQLVDDLLDMEKLVSGKMTLNMAPESIPPIIRDSIERLRTYAVDCGVSVVLLEDSGLPEITTDKSRLNQAFSNLLSNAIKFSPLQGKVTVTLEQKENHFEIRVTDQGPGVPESFRSRIFQKFAQADSSATRSIGGTGLGLAITREIMTQMGGEVGFESEEGRGANFWLKLPITQKNPEA